MPHRVMILGSMLFFIAVGCSQNNGVPTAEGIAMQDSLAKGLQAFESKDWAGAEKDLALVLKSARLQPDGREKVLLAHVKALIELGRLDEAEAGLFELHRGAGEMDRVYLLKCEWAIKKGLMAEAKSAFDEAKKLNKLSKPPEGLKL